MRNQLLFLFLFCLSLFQSNAQNQPSPHKEKMEEFRTLFIQNVQIQSGRLHLYKNINFKIDSCSVILESIDFENNRNEKIVIFMPTSGVLIKENGELFYKNKAIKEIIENKVSKKIKTCFYNNSKKIGLFLIHENKEMQHEIQEGFKMLASHCAVETRH